MKRPCQKFTVIITLEVEVTMKMCNGTFKEDFSEVIFDLRSEKHKY